MAVRRRRRCTHCSRRFTTFERVANRQLIVDKRDGRKELLDAEKMRNGLLAACNKRPVSMNKIEGILRRVLRRLHKEYATEVPSRIIGQMILEELRRVDQVAYIRFASVYRSFSAPEQFVQEAKQFERRGI